MNPQNPRNRNPLNPLNSLRSIPVRPPQPTVARDSYATWYENASAAFADYSKMKSFPAPPAPRFTCTKPVCIRGKGARALELCACDVEKAFKMLQSTSTSGAPPKLVLSKERLKWHPDRFSKCPEELRADFQKKAKEVFVVVDRMYAAEKAAHT